MSSELYRTFPKIHEKQHCPACDEGLDSMTAVGHDGEPEIGSIAICIKCGMPLEYDGEKLIECDVTKLPILTMQIIERVQNAIHKSRISCE